MTPWKEIFSPDNYKEFKGKSVIIAGGADGIGAELVRVFHNEFGAKVAILDRNVEKAQALASELKTRPSTKHMVFPVDIADQKSREDAINAIIAKNGPPKLFISTIGFDKRFSFDSLSDRDLQQSMAINGVGPVMAAKQLIAPGADGRPAPMREAGGGVVCLFTSRHGSEINQPDMLPYGGAKAFLDAGMRRLAVHAGENNTPDNVIRVFNFSPGWVQTPNQIAAHKSDSFKAAAGEQLIPVPMLPQDIVPPVVNLVSRHGGKLYSGRTFHFDGGEGQVQRGAVTSGSQAKNIASPTL